jgi:hypothetical protein
MSHDATADGPDYGMVTCDVAGHSADHRAFQTSRGVRRADGRQQCQRRYCSEHIPCIHS